MKKGYFKFGLVFMSLGVLNACSEDAPPLGVLPPGGGSGSVSATEAAAINQALVGKAFDGWGFDQATPAQAPAAGPGVSLSSAPIAIDFQVDASADCELGGSSSVSGSITGTIDDTTFDGTLNLDVQTSMSACSFPADQTMFTMTTNPDLHLQGSVSWDVSGQSGNATFTYDGGLIWNTADGRAGNCLIDLSVTVDPSGTEVATGTVCGHSV